MLHRSPPDIETITVWGHDVLGIPESYELRYDLMRHTHRLKPGLHEPQLPVERSITLVSSTVVKRRCYA